MTTMTGAYAAYLAVCVGITIWVAQTLRKQGRVVLTDGHETGKDLSDAFSHLLVVGFYLVNLGVISFYLKIETHASDTQTAIELVSTKVGTILVVLGAMHFVIVATLARVRHTTETRRAEQAHRAALLQRRRSPGEPVFEVSENLDR